MEQIEDGRRPYVTGEDAYVHAIEDKDSEISKLDRERDAQIFKNMALEQENSALKRRIEELTCNPPSLEVRLLS